MLLGPARPAPAALVQDALPLHMLVAAQVQALGHLAADAVGQLGTHEGTHLVAEGQVVGSEVEVQEITPKKGGDGKAVGAAAGGSVNAGGL